MPSQGEARLQAGAGVAADGAAQESRAVSANVSRVDQAPGQILGSRGRRAFVAKALAKSFGMEGAVREMVYRRQAQPLRELPGSTSHDPPPEQGRDFVGRRAGRTPHPDLSAIASRGL